MHTRTVHHANENVMLNVILIQLMKMYLMSFVLIL